MGIRERFRVSEAGRGGTAAGVFAVNFGAAGVFYH